MTRVLVLGGTGWLSGEVARRWAAVGAEVTCLARGGRPAPEGAMLVVADRAEPDAYGGVAGGDWDEVVDVTSRAAHAASAVAALADRAAHWTYVSTLSVYARNDEIGADETADVLQPAEPDAAEYDYGREKVAAEAAVRTALGDRAAVLRPGLIVGPGDPTDRFGYWVARLALAGEGSVLVPEVDDRAVQVVDVADLADALVAVGRARWAGVANAICDPSPFRAFLDLARDAAGHTGALVPASDDWLLAHDVAYWMGPRSLPLWLPADMPGFSTRTNSVYRSAGGSFRPLAQTLADTLDDERVRGLDRERGTGLSRDAELALLAELG